MPLSPGRYTIYDTDPGRVLAYYGSHVIGTWGDHKVDFQRWYVKCFPGSSKYAMQNVQYERYLTMGVDGGSAHGVEEEFWRFERIGDDTSSILKPRPSDPISTPSAFPTATLDLFPQGSDSAYNDEAHFHTDMLFNMPRAPFSRIQRIAALDWARKLGATNVPTMASVDECERRLETASGSNNNPARNG
ncbi:hypothetical protein RSAG8_04923, partial [Rhizoctonia solani AG-8 WAC10335]